MSEQPGDFTADEFYVHCARNATDEKLIVHLLNAIACAQLIPQPDPARLEAGIAELMCEAVRRGLDIPELVHEPMLPTHALRRVEAAISTDDAEMAWNALPYLDAKGLWIVFNQHERLPQLDTPSLWLEEIAFHLERRIYSDALAQYRWECRRSLDMADADYTALLTLAIDALFGRILIRLGLEQSTEDQA